MIPTRWILESALQERRSIVQSDNTCVQSSFQIRELAKGDEYLRSYIQKHMSVPAAALVFFAVHCGLRCMLCLCVFCTGW